MGIHTTWLDDNRQIVLTQIDTDWNWDDVISNKETVRELALSVNYPVALIVLLPHTVSLPPSGFAPHSRKVIQNHTELEIHTIVYITKIPYTITLWKETITAMTPDPSRYFFASDLDEAIRIADSRST